MIKKIKKECQCPKCNNRSDADIWEEFDETAKESAISMETFLWKCEACGHKLKFIYPCIYTNDKKSIVIRCTDQKDARKEANLLYLPKENDARSTLRICTTMEEFTEKVRILEDGYDDRAMELLKLITMAKLHQQDSTIVDLYYYQATQEGKLQFTVITEDEQYAIELTKANYTNLIAIVQEELQPLDQQYYNIDFAWASSQV